MTSVNAYPTVLRMIRRGVVIAVGLGALAWGQVAVAGSARDHSGGGGRARLGAPEDVAYDAAGHLFVSEFSGNRVTRIVRFHARAVAGTGVAGYSGDGGPAVDARLNAPTGLFVERSGSLLLADHHNGCIRQVNPSGVIIAIVGRCGHQGFSGDGGPATAARLNDPIGITEDNAGNLYIADEQNARVRKVSSRGVIATIAPAAAGGVWQPRRTASSRPKSS